MAITFEGVSAPNFTSVNEMQLAAQKQQQEALKTFMAGLTTTGTEIEDNNHADMIALLNSQSKEDLQQPGKLDALKKQMEGMATWGMYNKGVMNALVDNRQSVLEQEALDADTRQLGFDKNVYQRDDYAHKTALNARTASQNKGTDAFNALERMMVKNEDGTYDSDAFINQLGLAAQQSPIIADYSETLRNDPIALAQFNSMLTANDISNNKIAFDQGAKLTQLDAINKKITLDEKRLQLDAAVAEGRISQAQRDFELEKFKAEEAAAVNRTNAESNATRAATGELNATTNAANVAGTTVKARRQNTNKYLIGAGLTPEVAEGLSSVIKFDGVDGKASNQDYVRAFNYLGQSYKKRGSEIPGYEGTFSQYKAQALKDRGDKSIFNVVAAADKLAANRLSNTDWFKKLPDNHKNYLYSMALNGDFSTLTNDHLDFVLKNAKTALKDQMALLDARNTVDMTKQVKALQTLFANEGLDIEQVSRNNPALDKFRKEYGKMYGLMQGSFVSNNPSWNMGSYLAPSPMRGK